MRALILVAGAALAVSACSSNDAANNTMNVDENLTAPADMNATDMNATDMNATDMNATNATDANATAADANSTANASTNNAM